MQADPGFAGSDFAEPTLTPTEVRRRASVGVAILGAQGIAIQLLNLAGSIVLARLLLPRDFGIVAVGMTLMTTMSYLSGWGLGASLIRRPETPTRQNLETLFGLQLTLMSFLGLAGAAAAWPFGEAGRVTALIVAFLPLLAFRIPGWILLERDLSYRPLAVVAVTEAVAFNVWAIATVAVGWGVWGLATGAVARLFIGSAALICLAPVKFLRPDMSPSRIRALLRFGLMFQAADLARIGRDQGINVGIAVISNYATVGLWSAANRLLQIPNLFLGNLYRVSYPAMSRLTSAGEDIRALLERIVRLVAVSAGLILVPIAASAPALIPGLLGSKWAAAADVLPTACLGLMLSAPVSVASVGYLLAVGDATTPFRGTAFMALAWFAVAFGLLPVIGISAVGLGLLAALLVEAAILGKRAMAHSGVRFVAHMRLPALAAVGCGAAGWFLSSALSPSLLTALLAGAVAQACYLGTLVILSRELVGDTFQVFLGASRASLTAIRQPKDS